MTTTHRSEVLDGLVQAIELPKNTRLGDLANRFGDQARLSCGRGFATAAIVHEARGAKAVELFVKKFKTPRCA